MEDRLTDDEVEQILAGETEDGAVGSAFRAIKARYEAIPAAEPAGPLAEFVSAELVRSSYDAAEGAEAASVISLDAAPSRRRAARLAALTGTLVGKALVGATIAAASVAGIHAGGIVDVPVLPQGMILADELSALETTEESSMETSEADADTSATRAQGADDGQPPASAIPPDSSDGSGAGATLDETTIPVADAGMITVTFDRDHIITFVAVANEGWDVDAEQDVLRAQASFHGPQDVSVGVRVEVTTDGLQVDIDDDRDDPERDTADDDETESGEADEGDDSESSESHEADDEADDDESETDQADEDDEDDDSETDDSEAEEATS